MVSVVNEEVWLVEGCDREWSSEVGGGGRKRIYEVTEYVNNSS